jgi:hypothetical protein
MCGWLVVWFNIVFFDYLDPNQFGLFRRKNAVDSGSVCVVSSRLIEKKNPVGANKLVSMLLLYYILV